MSRLHRRVNSFILSVFDGQFRLEGGRNYAVPCPFHGDRPGRQHLYIARESGLWICFKCEEKGNFFSLVRRMSREDSSIDPSDFLDGLSSDREYRLIGMAQPANPKPRGEYVRKRDDYPKGTVPAWVESDGIIEGRRKRGLAYLERRGISLPMIEFFEVRIGITGRYECRVLFPVIDPEDLTPLGWVARTWDPKGEPKVLNTPSEGRSVDETLFGLHAVRGVLDSVILVEGIFDAVKHGPQFLALQGKTLTTSQFAQLVKSGFKQVTVMLDHDARHEGRRLARSLKMHVPTVKYATIEGAKDPGDATWDQVVVALQEARQA